MEQYNVRVDGLNDRRHLPLQCFFTCAAEETMWELLHRLQDHLRYYNTVPALELATIFGFALGRASTMPAQAPIHSATRVGDIGDHATRRLELQAVKFAQNLIRGIRIVMTGGLDLQKRIRDLSI